MHLDAALKLIKPSLRKRFIKKLTRDRREPTWVGMSSRSPHKEGEGWWRRRESTCFTALITNKLLEINDAQNAPNARYAALKYVRSTWALTLLKSSAESDNFEHK